MGSGTHFSKLMISQEPVEPMLTETLSYLVDLLEDNARPRRGRKIRKQLFLRFACTYVWLGTSHTENCLYF